MELLIQLSTLAVGLQVRFDQEISGTVNKEKNNKDSYVAVDVYG